jgi:hypothetical protein
MRVIINGVVAGLAEHPRLAYLSQQQYLLGRYLGREFSEPAPELQYMGLNHGEGLRSYMGLEIIVSILYTF